MLMPTVTQGAVLIKIISEGRKKGSSQQIGFMNLAIINVKEVFISWNTAEAA